MTADERQLLYDKLMEGARLENVIKIEKIVNHELDLLEPILDVMLAARSKARLIPEQDAHLELEIEPHGEHTLVRGSVAGFSFKLTMPTVHLVTLAHQVLERTSQ